MAIAKGDGVLLEMIGGVHVGPSWLQGVTTSDPSGGNIDVQWNNGTKVSGVPVASLLKLKDPSDLTDAVAKYYKKFVRFLGGPSEFQGLLVAGYMGEDDGATKTEAFAALLLVGPDGGATSTVLMLDLGEATGNAIIPLLDAHFAVQPNSVPRR